MISEARYVFITSQTKAPKLFTPECQSAKINHTKIKPPRFETKAPHFTHPKIFKFTAWQ